MRSCHAHDRTQTQKDQKLLERWFHATAFYDRTRIGGFPSFDYGALGNPPVI